MRQTIIALSAAAFAAGLLAQPAAAAKTKMGCEIGKEVWNATEGKCVPGKPKYAKKSTAKATAKTSKATAKKAPPKQ